MSLADFPHEMLPPPEKVSRLAEAKAKLMKKGVKCPFPYERADEWIPDWAFEARQFT